MQIRDDVARSVRDVAVVLEGFDERASKEIIALALGFVLILSANTKGAAEEVALLELELSLPEEKVVVVSGGETRCDERRGIASLEIKRIELHAAVLCLFGSDVVLGRLL